MFINSYFESHIIMKNTLHYTIKNKSNILCLFINRLKMRKEKNGVRKKNFLENVEKNNNQKVLME